MVMVSSSSPSASASSPAPIAKAAHHHDSDHHGDPPHSSHHHHHPDDHYHAYCDTDLQRHHHQYPPHQLYYPPAPEPDPAAPPPSSDHYGYPLHTPGSMQYQPEQVRPPQAGALNGSAAPALSVQGRPSSQPSFYPPPVYASNAARAQAPYPPMQGFPPARAYAGSTNYGHSHAQSQGSRQAHEQTAPYPPGGPYQHAPSYPTRSHAAGQPAPMPYPAWPTIAPSPFPPQAQPMGGSGMAGHFSVHSGGASGQWSAHPTGPGTGRRTVTEAPLSLTQNAAQFKSPEHKRKVADYARLMLGADPDASPSFLPYRSFGEAVSLNPIYISIGALSVYCTLCQKAFKMSTKCNLRFVQRHEQSLKHTDQLRKILSEYPALDDAGNPVAVATAAASDATAPSDHAPTDSAAPRADSAWSTAASSRASTSVISTPAGSRPTSASPPPIPVSPTAATSPGEARLGSSTSATGNLGSSVIAKKAYLEESFVKHVEQNPLFTIVDETTVYCLPCAKRLKLDRARSPRTVLLHCASQVHLIKLNKYRLGEQAVAQQHVLGGSAAASAVSGSDAPATSGEGAQPRQEPAKAPSERRSPNLPAIVTQGNSSDGRATPHDHAGHGLVTPQSAALPADHTPGSTSAWPPSAESHSSASSGLRSPAHAHQPPIHPLPPADRRFILPLPTPTWPYTQPPSAHAPTFPHHYPPMSPNKHMTPLQSPPPSATSWARYPSAPAASASLGASVLSSLPMTRRASPYPTASVGAVPLPLSVTSAPQLQSPPAPRRANSNSPATPPAAATASALGRPSTASPAGSTGSPSGNSGKKMSLQFLVD